MPRISKNALVPYSAARMYALVDDIAAYPEFLPWCGGSTEINRDDDEVEATIVIAHSGLQKSFTTRNRLQKNKMIEISLVDGPFRHLHGFWRFDALAEDACKVSFDLEYEFSSRLVGMALGPVFSQIANALLDAFCQRARSEYGQ
ncbi:MAG: type II toxin-antitoxin system RatA family toxin [Gammaproteobacteria bacterium]|nr:type II toxin-antitoxin system RatA family toxin [Gammaproteobacteria bacterium]